MMVRCVKMFCTNTVDSGCRQSLLSVPQGVSSAWGGRFLCSLAISPPPHILPPPWLPKPLHYSSSHYPHSQPLTDKCASRQRILPYFTIHMWSSVISTHHQLKHDERNTPLNLTDYMKITYENSFILNMESLGSSKAVWFTVKEKNRHRSFWNVKYFRAAGLWPIERREERREDGGGGLKVRKMRKEG